MPQRKRSSHRQTHLCHAVNIQPTAGLPGLVVEQTNSPIRVIVSGLLAPYRYV